MPRPAAEDRWISDEAEAFLDMDGRRKRLEEVAAGIQNGEIQLADHLTARDQIEKRIRDHRPE